MIRQKMDSLSFELLSRMAHMMTRMTRMTHMTRLAWLAGSLARSLSRPMNFPWKGNFLFNDSRISYDQRFMSPEFSMETCHRVFHGPWNHRTRLSDNWIFHELISSMSIMGHETIEWDFHWVLIFHQSKYHVFHGSWIAYNGTSIGYEYGWGCAP